MLYCLFRHMASQVLRDVVVRAGQRAVVRQLSAGAVASLLKTVGVSVTQRVAGTAASRWVPVVGAAAVGAYAYWDTLQVAKTGATAARRSRGAGEHRADARLTMCGRYELHSHPAAIALAFGLAAPPDVHPHYNIAPMTDVPIVRIDADGERELVRMRWGLVPRWAKDPSIGAKMINARGETIADKPSFRTAYRRHRCLLPADGFYEWMSVGGARARAQAAAAHRHEGRLAVRVRRTLRALAQRRRRSARHVHDRHDRGEQPARARCTTGCR